jgi:iron(III) transport system permease protein
MGTVTRLILAIVVVAVFSVSLQVIFQDSGVRIFGNTLLLGLASAAISIPLGAFVASACKVAGSFVRACLLLLIVAAALVPFYLQVSAWDSLFGKMGWVITAQGKTLVPLFDGWTATIWVHSIAATPWVALMFLLRFAMDDSIGEEQALLDTGPVSIFFRLSIRKYLPIVLLALIWNVALVEREIVATDLYKVTTLAEDIYLRIALGEFDRWNQTHHHNPWSVILAQIGCLGSIVFVGIWIAGSVYPWARLSQRQGFTLVDSRRRRLFGWIALAIFSVVVVLGPLISMLIRAGVGIETRGTQLTAEFSLGRMVDVIRRVPIEYYGEFCWTLTIGALSATIVTLVAIFGASYARRRRNIQIAFILICAIFVSTPGPVVGLILYLFSTSFETNTLVWLRDRTVAFPVMAVSVVALPWAFFLASIIWQRIGEDELDAVALDATGTSWFFAQFSVRNWLIVGTVWMLSLVLAMGDLSASFYLVPPGVDTLSRRTLGLLHSGVNNETAALGIWNYLLVLLIASLTYAMALRIKLHSHG